MPYELTVVNPSGNSTKVPLEVFPFSIGRHSENNLILRDSRVSRKHAQILLAGRGLRIEDLESLHGVRVNGEKHLNTELRNGDVVDFGLEDGYRIIVDEKKNEAEVRKLMGKLPGQAASGRGGNELSNLRALTEVARSLEHALSTEGSAGHRD